MANDHRTSSNRIRAVGILRTSCLLWPIALALPSARHTRQSRRCDLAVTNNVTTRQNFLTQDDAAIARALPILSEWSGDPAVHGLLPDSRDSVGLRSMLDHLESASGPRAPLVLLSIVHWGFSGYRHLWQQGLAANVYVDAGFPLDRLAAVLLDTAEGESARLQAFVALGRSDAALGRLSAARQEIVCRLAADTHDSAAADGVAGDLLTGALAELAVESRDNRAVGALLDDSAVARAADVLVRDRRLSADWRMAPTPPLTLYLNSSAPGRETTLTIVAASGTVSIRADSVRSLGDTSWAITPAIVTVGPSARQVVVATSSDVLAPFGSFSYSWRNGTVSGNRIEIQHQADGQSFSMTAAQMEITR